MIRLVEIRRGEKREWNIIHGQSPRFAPGQFVRAIELTPEEAARPVAEALILFQTHKLKAQRGSLL